MDNLTHTLFGAALAEIALARRPEGAARRRVLLVASLLGANFPDFDLVYTWIAPEPLGYLLHHRGHTHTLAGLAPQAALVSLGCWLLRGSWRALERADKALAVLLAAVNLVFHVVLDSWNSYGVHPFYPFDARWYYGDAIFIFEPWLWVALGPAALLSWRSRAARAALLLAAGAAAARFLSWGLLSGWSALAILASALGCAAIMRRLSPLPRSALALALVAGFVAGSLGLSRHARGAVAAEISPEGGEILDVVLSPHPARPTCWSFIALERRGDAFRARRGTISVLPGLQPAASCPLHARYAQEGDPPSRPSTSQIAWIDEISQPISRFEDLARDDCWFRAWMQFARAPVIAPGSAYDLRFSGRGRDNFTTLELADAPRGCPPNLTRWAPPRAELLPPESEDGEEEGGAWSR